MNLLDLLFPKSCLECNSGSKYICSGCLKKVGEGKVDPLNGNYAYFKYKGVFRKAIIKLKYNFAKSLADELIEACLQQNNNIPNITGAVIVAVPLSRKRNNWRGFNQASLLGGKIAKKNNWIFEEKLLLRVKSGVNQARLNREKRLRNMSGKFAVNKDLIDKYWDKSIIVFDDVITTGSTINECKKVLKESGIKKVYGLSVCG